MHRITISLPDELAAIVAREADRNGTSVSDIVRRALAASFGLDSEGARDLPFAAIGRSGHSQTARDAEEILAREWGGDRRR
jgi:hypothetical protein